MTDVLTHRGRASPPATPAGPRGDPGPSSALPTRELSLSPAAVHLLNAIAAATTPAIDPWSKYPPVLQVRHVAEILGCKEKSVGEAARRGNIPFTKRLGRYMVDQVAFRAWLVSEERSS